ncbi:Protein SOSEKI 1 [Ophidiomyces ophidiicola]|uniref:Protein SOSEKI 1 n=1 Tax=Ophidiomyces ophidiicola TaxID=1387563 RepID=A0ACB8URX4_9EURO|nr:Protein SOSEKI 1 [Ophidiomyces ophidiicola]KAI1908571.1 Protein SOSEKI 1 [Ophidiomyces ophidiicola]KAI1910171.1 Protein SOSEKI 1 [Ophidiomyces ophidiicola]KAI1921432.1 Protein SOSEKI 1 [Ophidiomyces ophidiicola]KAI1936420.1 Protein SOSEKI 1 [Ophidiomyces ophidiicola]KAI1940902.1 Protein SOSEKI 1 [Ophidiomyces ophidiicola]
MNLKPKAEPARRPHEKEDEDSDCGEWWPGKDSKTVPKQDSRDCSTNSSPSRKSKLHKGNGRLQHVLSSRYNYYHHAFSALAITKPKPTTMGVPVPSRMSLDERSLQLLQSAERLPPVTKGTLSELDLDHILRNINLRVDVNFDRDLHFRPVDGKKGQEKRRLAEGYWEAVALEISIYTYMGSPEGRKDNDNSRTNEPQAYFEPRLPGMLETLKDVLWTLVPERDHMGIAENLDIPFIMQQVEKGVLDITGLFLWLAELLKSHCAPMRDQWADQMVNEIQGGFASMDMAKAVQGIKTLFCILEAMKLDVANHQIRAFRLILIEDTVRFLQIYFLRRLLQDSIHGESARKWFHAVYMYEQVYHQTPPPEWAEFDNVTTLLRGLSHFLLCFNSPSAFPETFEFDTGRLWGLRYDVQDLIAFEICIHVFDVVATSHIRHIPRNREVYLKLESHIWSIVDCADNRDPDTIDDQRWRNNIDSIALEIARTISDLEAESKGATSSLPDEHVLLLAGKMLESCFASHSRQYKHFQCVIQERLEEEVLVTARRYMDMSSLDMCEDQPCTRSDGRSEDRLRDIENIAKRLCHIGVLHWRVWGPILYTRDPYQPVYYEGKRLSYDAQQRLLLHQLENGGS